MDRNRLKEVHQTDLTESRVNEDFVDWLKTKGPSWLLMILVGVIVYLGLLRWKQYRIDHFNAAWGALQSAQIPGSFVDVAEKFGDVRGLPQQALLHGANALLESVQTGRPLGAASDATAAPTGLTATERQENLHRARELYLAVLDTDDGSLPLTLYAVSAMQGLAVVSESLGEVDEAKQWFERAGARAEAFYPELAERVRRRAGTVDEFAEPVELPAQAELPPPMPREDREPATIDEALRELILPDEAGAG